MALQTWRFVPRGGTKAQWTTANPVLSQGEIGHETDTQAQKIGDGSTAWNSLAYTDYAPGTRTGVYAFEQCGGSSNSWPNQPFNNRHLFQLPVKATRMRVHVKNRSQLTDTNVAGTLTNMQLFLGRPAADSTTGEPNGNFTSTPVQIQAPTSLASGSELITPWYTLSGKTDYNTYLLSIGWITSSTGGLAFSGGLMWQTGLNTDCGLVAPSGLTRVNNAAFLQIWIEYEYADNFAPRIIIAGNSLSNSSHGGTPDNYGTLGSWAQLWAKSNGGVAANLAVGGIYGGGFIAGNGRWDVFDSCATAFVPDAVVYFALVSSDTVDLSVSSAQTNMIGAIQKGKSKYPNARHIVTNIPPRIAFTAGAVETKRQQMNTWLHMLPVGTESCVDIDSLVTDFATPARLRTEYNADDTHFNCRGHERASEVIPVRRVNS